MKTCNKCGNAKPDTEFQRDARTKSGLNAQCKDCVNSRHREYYLVPEKLAQRRANANRWARENTNRLKPKRQEQYRQNREKCIAKSKAYRLRNPTAKYASELKAKYGISLDDYNRMAAEQGGVCRLCKMPPAGKCRTDRILHVDHSHTTGKVRALLCLKCNRALGMFGDDINALTNAAMYLAEYDFAPFPVAA
jgi:hypothetical protein